MCSDKREIKSNGVRAVDSEKRSFNSPSLLKQRYNQAPSLNNCFQVSQIYISVQFNNPHRVFEQTALNGPHKLQKKKKKTTLRLLYVRHQTKLTTQSGHGSSSSKVRKNNKEEKKKTTCGLLQDKRHLRETESHTPSYMPQFCQNYTAYAPIEESQQLKNVHFRFTSEL